jgi:hypothetical protein
MDETMTIPELIERLQKVHDLHPDIRPYIMDSEFGWGEIDALKFEDVRGGEQILVLDSSDF